MKTAISIPDDLFEQSEELAGRLGLSRSGLYQRALEELLARVDERSVTARIDQVLKDAAGEPEQLLRRAGRRRLRALEHGE